jgi:hypothetical protein
MAEKVPIHVVLGIEIDGKPHASRFVRRDASLVARAAELMGFHGIQVAADKKELYTVARALPLGKIFATGRAFVPFVAQSAFDKLATLVEGGITARAPRAIVAKQPGPPSPRAAMFEDEAVNTADTLWSKIEVGTVVLAAQPNVWGPGWWEGIVVSIDGDDLTLRWIESPADKPFRASRRDVALRHPGAG